LALAKRIYI